MCWYYARFSRLGTLVWHADRQNKDREPAFTFLELTVESGQSLIKLQPAKQSNPTTYPQITPISLQKIIRKLIRIPRHITLIQIIIMDNLQGQNANQNHMPLNYDNTDTIDTNVPFLAGSCAVALFLLLLITLYRVRFYDSPPIVAILAMLLLNDFLQLACESPSYFSNLPNAVCLVSITGTTFFRLASYYWLIFITRLLYREKHTPGKFLDLSKYVSKNIVFTYIPSIAVALVVIIAANLDDTSSQSNCWRLIRQKSATDYVVYLCSFVLPNLLALMITLGYLLAYCRTSGRQAKTSHSLCLAFPVLAVPFILYELLLRLMVFFGQWQLINVLDVPFLFHPICHGLIFALVLRNLYQGKKPTESDLTIKEPSLAADSFIGPEEPQ